MSSPETGRRTAVASRIDPTSLIGAVLVVLTIGALLLVQPQAHMHALGVGVLHNIVQRLFVDIV